MKFLKLLFFDKNGEFSWRKCGTALTYLSFTTACLGHQISTGFSELPSKYLAIIAGVFVFYFGKGLIDGKKIKVE